MLTRNGSCVTQMAKISAGSSGSRRRHGEEKGSPALPFTGAALSFSVASAALTSFPLLDRLGCDLLALAERGGVLRRAGDHAREELRAAVSDILELWDAHVLHSGQPRPLRRAGIVDRGGLHRGQRLRGERCRSLLVLRDPVRREPRARRDRSPAALGLRAGGLDVALA